MEKSNLTTEQILAEIAKIDDMFETSTCWGSWMVSVANEREALVNHLNARGSKIEHKYLARTASGGRTD